ncbi:MAG TPA: hypothetical protein VHI93_04515, partial [Candidatus Thermoplasmatota archaeon]|nr:hypothetical protein [Candidatus Thermoplasmatota archaeon]
QWTVAGGAQPDLRLQAPRSDRPGLLVATPASVPANTRVAFAAAVANHGSPVQAAVQWRVVEVERKGPPMDRPDLGLKAERLGAWSSGGEVEALGMLPTGATARAFHNATPPRPGLYRATATFHADGIPTQTAQLEFLVGQSGIHYAVDFASPAGLSGWRDGSDAAPPPGGTTGGGSPPTLKWRLDDGRFIWGVNTSRFQAGTTYCTESGAGCNAQGSGSPQSVDYTGLEGIALSPRVNLTRLPQGNAILTLRHGHGFEAGDGGLLEAKPLATPVDEESPQPAFECDGEPPEAAWFRLDPLDGAYRGAAWSLPPAIYVATGPGGTRQLQYAPPLRNPLAPDSPVAVVGGPFTVEETIAFDLGQPAVPLCPGVPSVSLANYTVEFRLRTGTQPGLSGPRSARAGALGWQVDAFQVSSVNLDLRPAARALPLLDGAPKRFLLEVRNTGAVPDVVRLGVDANASSPAVPAWVSFEQGQVALEPGQAALVPYVVHIPAGAAVSSGTYRAVLAAASTRNPLLERRAQVDLVLGPNPLPDLQLQAVVDAPEMPPRFEAGTLAVV